MVALRAQDPESVLKQNCVSCHGAAKVSGLDLRTREGILKGGERGPAIELGHHEKSRLWRFVAGLEKPQMPPGKTLSDAELKVLRQWIDTGAPLESKPEPSEGDKAALAKLEERPITPEEKNYWAFRPVVRPAIPVEAKNPVDAFLLAAQQTKGLKPAPGADRRTLIRRAYLDLSGLPGHVRAELA